MSVERVWVTCTWAGGLESGGEGGVEICWEASWDGSELLGDPNTKRLETSLNRLSAVILGAYRA